LSKDAGSFTIEAAIILPFFISFVLILYSFIQIAAAQIALQSAVFETNEQIATHMYPVKLLYDAAKRKYKQNKIVMAIQNVIDQANQTQQKVNGVEDFALHYASLIPKPIVLLLEWEKKQREYEESRIGLGTEKFADQSFQLLLNKAFTQIVLQFADKKKIHPSQFHVIDVKLPDLNQSNGAFIAIEAQYDFILQLPFFHRTISLRKKAMERIWVGATS